VQVPPSSHARVGLRRDESNEGHAMIHSHYFPRIVLSPRNRVKTIPESHPRMKRADHTGLSQDAGPMRSGEVVRRSDTTKVQYQASTVSGILFV
jgi:hypothetical protein